MHDLKHLLGTLTAQSVVFSSPLENCGQLFACALHRTWLMFRPQRDGDESNNDPDGDFNEPAQRDGSLPSERGIKTGIARVMLAQRYAVFSKRNAIDSNPMRITASANGSATRWAITAATTCERAI